MLRALEAFPLDCTEQAASRALGLASVQGWAGEDRAARLQQAVASVLNRQRFDGGFALWSAQGPAVQWLSAYATEALLRARAAGATVPDAALNAALRYLEDALEDAFEETPAGLAAQAARLHALAPHDPDTRLEWQEGLSRPAYAKTPAIQALYDHAARLAREIGFTIPGERVAGGGSDGNFTGALGVPTLDGMGVIGDAPHTHQEHLLVSWLEPRARLLQRLFETLGEG
jgi:acetylornithine deacetylase/succinyl-diaminopimelate desuccinylase-like protein